MITCTTRHLGQLQWTGCGCKGAATPRHGSSSNFGTNTVMCIYIYHGYLYYIFYLFECQLKSTSTVPNIILEYNVKKKNSK